MIEEVEDRTKNTRIQQMLNSGKIRGGKELFLDCYNQSVSEIAGTISTRIDGSGHFWVAIPEEMTEEDMRVYGRDVDLSGYDGDPQVLTPARTEEGKRIRREIGDNGGITFANRKWTPRSDGISNTLTKVEKDNLLIEPLRVRQATKEGYIEVLPGGVVDLSYPTSATRRGRVQEGGLVTPTLTRNTENSIYRYEGIMETKDKKGYGTFKDENTGKTYIYRIRKLTPRECFRLMGVSETNIDNIQNAGISRTQQYKMAGNSIVTDVLYHIFRNLFCEHEKTTLF